MRRARRDRKVHEAAEGAAHDARLVLEYARLEQREARVDGVVLKPGEFAYLVVEQAGFIEPKRLPGHWSGGSHGVSFRIAKGVRYHVGGSRGTFRQGPEAIQATDFGKFVLTNHRALFIGAKKTTEWAFSKLVGFSLEGEGGTALFNVSNRQKASGVIYGTANEAVIEATIAAAIARFQGEAVHRALLDELETAAIEAERAAGIIEQEAAPSPASLASPSPPPPAPVQPAAAPAGWLPDPSGRFQHRYWNGARWTENVATNGVASTDPAG